MLFKTINEEELSEKDVLVERIEEIDGKMDMEIVNKLKSELAALDWRMNVQYLKTLEMPDTM